MTVVLEQDGTVIDEDDILEGLQPQTLQLLGLSESWTPEDQSNSQQPPLPSSPPPCPTSPSNTFQSSPPETPQNVLPGTSSASPAAACGSPNGQLGKYQYHVGYPSQDYVMLTDSRYGTSIPSIAFYVS